MATTVKLLRPVDGKEVGSIAEYPDADAKRMEQRGAVEIVKGKPAEKAAPEPENKKAPEVANKAAPVTRKKGS